MYSEPSPRKVAEHGFDCFVCPNLLYNPHAPAMPGAPGLLFAVKRRPYRDADRKPPADDPRSYPVFIRLGPAQWLYVGEYKVISGDPITPAQWRVQTNKVKMTWAENICKTEWGRRIRMSILYRRINGKEPFFEDVAEMTTQVLGGLVRDNVTVDEISQAFDRGDELFRTMGMQCTGYNAAFHNENIAKFDDWVPPKPKRKPKRPAPKVKSESSPRPRKKAKRVSPYLDDSDSDTPMDDGMVIDDIDAITEPGYVHKGTRSRPSSAQVVY